MPFGVKKQLPGALRFFNLDLHLAVIADVKDTLYRCVLLTSRMLQKIGGAIMHSP